MELVNRSYCTGAGTLKVTELKSGAELQLYFGEGQCPFYKVNRTFPSYSFDTAGRDRLARETIYGTLSWFKDSQLSVPPRSPAAGLVVPGDESL